MTIHSKMKSIDTLYNSNYFRSRLEARWAVFFDQIGIRWQYESEGYDLGDGVFYLPDFWFPDHGFYGEVKPDTILNDIELDKIKRLCDQSGKELILFSGMPELKTFPIYGGGWTEDHKVIPFGANLMGRDKYDPYLWDCTDGYTFDHCDGHERWNSAVITAQTKRFEHRNK